VAAPPQEQLQQAEKPVVKTNGADVEGPIILNGQVGNGHRLLYGLLLLQGFLRPRRGFIQHGGHSQRLRDL
jgi:hypothetical protein